MGGSSSSSTTQSTDQRDERIAASDEAVVLRLDNSEITVTDPEAQAFLQETLTGAGELLNSVIDFAETSTSKTYESVDKLLTRSEGEEQRTLDRVVQLTGLVAAAFAAVYIFGRK